MSSGAEIPVLIVSGYLGSGKTTFVNHLLSSPAVSERKVALIINEFGPLGVDGALIEAGDRPLYEVNKGSLFCACTKVQLMEIMTTLLAAPPDLLVIEATGIAVPSEFTDLVGSPFLAGRFAVAAVVALVDAKHFLKVAPYMRAARDQVAAADGIVLNKTDLVDGRTVSDVQKVLKDLNPNAPVIRGEYGQVPDGWVPALKHRPLENPVATAPPNSIIAVSIESERALDGDRFKRVLERLGDRVLRLKGTIDFGDRIRFVEKAGSDLIIRDPLSADRTPPNNRTAFTVIARGISEQVIRAEFARCTAAALCSNQLS